MIWNHPIETTIYTQMFQVPGGRLTRWSYTLGVGPQYAIFTTKIITFLVGL